MLLLLLWCVLEKFTFFPLPRLRTFCPVCSFISILLYKQRSMFSCLCLSNVFWVAFPFESMIIKCDNNMKQIFILFCVYTHLLTFLMNGVKVGRRIMFCGFVLRRHIVTLQFLIKILWQYLSYRLEYMRHF